MTRDLDGLLAVTRVVYFAGIAASAWMLYRGRGRRLLFPALCFLLLIGWLASNWGLGRIYGLIVPGDRVRNLSWCMSAAAGNSPLGTGVIGQTSLEPFWASLVAALSLWSPERALVIYPYLSLFGILAVALSLYVHFRRFDERGELGSTGPPDVLLGVVVAASATLLATSPLDFLGPFRGYWAKMFLLKPNHTVGLILVPVVVGVLLRASSTWKCVAAGLALGLLSLAFVIHWAFVCFGLALYLLLTALLARHRVLSELRRVTVAVLVSGIFVLPGIYIIAKYFPHALTLAAGSYPEAPMRSDWGDTQPIGVPLLLLVTLEQGWAFYFGVVGALFWLRERTPASLTWAGLYLGAYALWGVNWLLYVTSRAREADEFYFFLLFTQAVAAGYGVCRGLVFLGRNLFEADASRRQAAAFAVVLAAPLGFPAWWMPSTMDEHYEVATAPIWPPIVETTDWIRRETSGADVFLAAGDMVQWVPALSGRRSLPFNTSQRDALTRLVQHGDAAALGARYILWSQELEETSGLAQADLVRSGCCRLVQDSHAIRVYRVTATKGE